MIFTNKYQMPEIYERLVVRQQRSHVSSSPSGRLSFAVTTLSDSPWKYKLTKKHDDEIVVDVSEFFFAFRGQMMHRALEQTPLVNVIPETSVGMEIDGVWVAGRMDVLIPRGIEDHKMKTVEAIWYHKDEDTMELARQLNPYKLMIERVFGMPIDWLAAHYYLMNWVGRKAKIDGNYPQAPCFEIVVPVWSNEETESYLRGRIELFKAPLEETELCNEHQRWARPTTYAVMKEGGKRAVRVLDSVPEAEEYIRNKLAGVRGVTVVERPGVDARCKDYCNAKRFCPYWQQRYQAEEEAEQ